MSFQEKRSLVSLLSTLLISGAYAALMWPRYPATGDYSPTLFTYWGWFFILFIPVTIVANIIIHILFSILNTLATHEEEPTLSDERDHLVELKSVRNGLYVFALGYIGAMAALAAEMPPVVMFLCFLGAGIGSQVVGDLSQFIYYRRGV